MDRQDLGSWISGPGSAIDGDTENYRGERLGLPEHGPGSASGWGRRCVAITIDWLAAVALARLTMQGESESLVSLVTLAIFALHVIAFTTMLGCSFGQRLLGIGVREISGRPLGFLGVAIRTFMICLVIPPLVWDRDGRGLHDRAVRSMVVRTSR